MFALWCAVKAPLMLGSDVRTTKRSDEAFKIITNKDLLAVNQDPLGVQVLKLQAILAPIFVAKPSPRPLA